MPNFWSLGAAHWSSVQQLNPTTNTAVVKGDVVISVCLNLCITQSRKARSSEPSPEQ